MPKTFEEKFREFVENSELSAYKIANQSGVGERIVARFKNEGTDVMFSNAAKIADALGLELVEKRNKKKGR